MEIGKDSKERYEQWMWEREIDVSRGWWSSCGQTKLKGEESRVEWIAKMGVDRVKVSWVVKVGWKMEDVWSERSVWTKVGTKRIKSSYQVCNKMCMGSYERALPGLWEPFHQAWWKTIWRLNQKVVSSLMIWVSWGDLGSGLWSGGAGGRKGCRERLMMTRVVVWWWWSDLEVQPLGL